MKKLKEHGPTANGGEYINVLRSGDAQRLDFIPDGVVDLTVTSPPYWNAIDYRSHSSAPTKNYRTRRTDDTYSEYLDFLKRCFSEVHRASKPGAFVCVIIGTVLENGTHTPLPHQFVGIMQSLGFDFHQDIVWHKCTAGIRRAGTFIQHPYPGYYHPNIMTEYILVFHKPGPPIYSGRSKEEKEQSAVEIDSLFTRDIANNLWNIAPVPPGVIDHPCPFPEDIAGRLIRLYSFKGMLVLDPFLGAGTTVKVARHLGRKFVGVDIEEKYVALARQRLTQPSLIRKQQLVLQYAKVAPGEILPAKNPKPRRYSRPSDRNGEDEIESLPLFKTPAKASPR